MGAIEERLWEEVVRRRLVSKPGASFPKKMQWALAMALQEWTARCIGLHLESILKEKGREDLFRQLRREHWQINHKGKRFLGAVRWQEVDVWLANPVAGLALAVDPKHFQSQNSLGKNWKNGLNDLIAFATSLHERFPACAVGGVISFPSWAATESDLKQIHSICCRTCPRERASNAWGKFEGLGLAVYDEAGNLVWPFEPESPLVPNRAFALLGSAVCTRTLSLL